MVLKQGRRDIFKERKFPSERKISIAAQEISKCGEEARNLNFLSSNFIWLVDYLKRLGGLFFLLVYYFIVIF